MKLGFSEAKIFIGENEVLKLTPQAREQSLMMMNLGSEVCPRVYRRDNIHFYIMEKLSQPNIARLLFPDIIEKIHAILKNVHSRPAVYNPNWIPLLEEFLLQQGHKEATKYLRDLYDVCYADYCNIHGDPTLANVMYRDYQLLLIDPVKPRGKVPSLREVDYGKMLQSALGWEAICTKVFYNEEVIIPYILKGVSPELHNKAWFWAAVNIIRIFPRAGSRPDVIKWGKEKVEYCWSQIK